MAHPSSSTPCIILQTSHLFAITPNHHQNIWFPRIPTKTFWSSMLLNKMKQSEKNSPKSLLPYSSTVLHWCVHCGCVSELSLVLSKLLLSLCSASSPSICSRDLFLGGSSLHQYFLPLNGLSPFHQMHCNISHIYDILPISYFLIFLPFSTKVSFLTSLCSTYHWCLLTSMNSKCLSAQGSDPRTLSTLISRGP